jgi:hypothetical protein
VVAVIPGRLPARAGTTAAARGFAGGAIAALAVAFAAAAPACVVAFGGGDASAAVVAVASVTTLLVVLFAAAAAVLVGRVQRSAAAGPQGAASPGHPGGHRPGRRGCVVGAVGGLAVAGAAVSAGPTDLVPVTIGLGVVSAAIAAAACTAGSYLGRRRTPLRLRTADGPGEATAPRRTRGWFGVAGGLVALAVAARHTGLVGADLVPYVAAGAVASVAAGALRPVARWIGFRAVRVTECVPEPILDVTVDGHVATAGEDPAYDGTVRADEDATEPTGDERRTGRFAWGTIAATGYLARRTDLDHVVALAVVGVALAGAATFAVTSGAVARHDRATVELGADRIVTVAPVSADRLTADVRAADPTGRYALATVVTPASAAGGAVVAVDGQRLAAVVAGGVRSGPTGAQLAALLRPKGLPPAAVTGPETPAGERYEQLPADTITLTHLDSPVPGVPAGGILVDLAAVPPPIAGTTSQVWLAFDAPPSLLDGLARHGLRVVARTSVDARAAIYADQPAMTVARFQLLAGIVMLCCAALLIGAVTRAHRGARTVARGFGLAVAVWAVGLVGALVARHAGPDFGTGFADGWSRVPPPPLVGTSSFVAFALESGLVLAVTVVAVVAPCRPWRGVVNPPGPARPLDGRPAAGSPAFTVGAGGGQPMNSRARRSWPAAHPTNDWTNGGVR